MPKMDGLTATEFCGVRLIGKLCNLMTRQLIELGLGLEASKRPFIWVIRKGNETKELQKWMEAYNFKKKTKGRGPVIRGWAPQVMILSHTAIRSFLTHCDWNSTLEGISTGVPMITWPLFSDQFNDEVLIVKMLKNGVSVGVQASLQWGEEEETEVAVKKEDVMKAIERVMSGTKESEEIRERYKELDKKANRAVEEGGSSHDNVKLFIDDLIDLAGGDPN
ncbi:UDP-glycosyltransferase 73C5-like [Cucumis melo var. makuwa]|uniref:UDP-glycosyltransferase 73C5-like n=1 Tax=Cucumis melo var. makuwa TaxID=1194695 RepID=A0A5D3D4J3_CUCMM|nr:UDP-glycosyltransferase 73C5-like [Cucumis melo var. makuwa]TYK18463.1 UDP-glycosyltransferase 73C5-like [Cucumis melo var. makuwa]